MNTSIVEVVKFKADGLVDLNASVLEMGRSVDRASAQLKGVEKVAASPVYAKYAANMNRIRDASERASLKIRNVGMAQRTADGSAVRQLRAVTELNRSYAQMQRRVELTARWGERFGGFLAKHGDRLSAVGRGGSFAAAAVGGFGAGMAHQGFSGTVEMMRYQTEVNSLAREFAGIMKPVLELMTKGARFLRQKLEKLDERGQNVAMAGILASSAIGGYGMLRMGAGLMGGLAGRGAAAAAPGILTGANAMAAANTGATAASAKKGGMSKRDFAKAGFFGSLLYLGAAAVDAPADRPRESGGEYYNRRRAAGETMAEAGSHMVGRAFAKMLGMTSGPKTKEQEEAERARRMVQLSGGGHDAPGTAYDRITSSIEKVEGGEPEGTRVLTAAMRELTEEMRRARGEPPLRRPSGV